MINPKTSLKSPPTRELSEDKNPNAESNTTTILVQALPLTRPLATNKSNIPIPARIIPNIIKKILKEEKFGPNVEDKLCIKELNCELALGLIKIQTPMTIKAKAETKESTAPI